MKLYYGFDTLCVFSYGFNPLMNKLYKSFGDQITFEFLPAGMWRGEDEKVLTHLSRKNMRQSIQRVGKMTGQPYGEAFIKHLKSLDSLNSYYGAKAMNTIMTFDGVDPLDYLASIYKKTFVDGKNTSDESLFCETAKAFDIDGNEFLQRLRSDEIETLTLSKIDKLLELGIESYPTLMLELDGEMETYPLNYDSYEALENWLKNILNKEADMKLIIVTGPQAVGKMAVGRAIEAKTDLKLFHNHMTIDMVISIFPYASKEAQKLIKLFRKEIFETMANSDQAGLIFTYLWGFDLPSDHAYIKALIDLFESKGAEVLLVELECDMEERLKRNKSPLRLQEKPSKRNIEWSENELIESSKKHRFNSIEGEIKHPNYLRINNTNLSETQVADKIINFFNL